MTQPKLAISGSPVILADYLVTDYQFDAASPLLGAESRTMSLEVNVGGFEQDEAAKHGNLQLDIFVGSEEFADTEDAPCHLRIMGHLLADPEKSNEELTRCAATATAQELYGVAKGILAALTAGAPEGRIVLPSIQLAEEGA